MFNSSATEIAALLKFKPCNFLGFEGGVGIIFGNHEFENYDKWFHNTLAWYFQIELNVFEILKFTPEIGKYDYVPYSGRYFNWGINTGIEF